MRLLTRYLSYHFLKVLILALGSFVALLLVSRLEEIARFAACGAPWGVVFRFIGMQIPYILPFALPLSALLSAWILFQRLSHSEELTALRASGQAFSQILSPLIFLAILGGGINFYLTSEVATHAHLSVRQMVQSLHSVNPLLLVQNTQIAQRQGAFVHMDPMRPGEAAQHILFAFPTDQERCLLYLAKKISVQENVLHAEGGSWISSLPGAEGDVLFIENQEQCSTSATACAQWLHQKGWKISPDHLSWSLLQARIQYLRQSSDKENQRLLSKCYTEQMRRLACALAVPLFAGLGAVLGTDIQRRPSRKRLILLLALVTATLTSLFSAKELGAYFFLAASLFLGPMGVIAGVMLFHIRQINRGIGS